MSIKGISRSVLFALSVSALGLKLIWGRPEVSLRGFLPSDVAGKAEFEKAFRAVTTFERAKQGLWILTQAPDVAGTPEDYKTARYMLSQFRKAGLDATAVE